MTIAYEAMWEAVRTMVRAALQDRSNMRKSFQHGLALLLAAILVLLLIPSKSAHAQLTMPPGDVFFLAYDFTGDPTAPPFTRAGFGSIGFSGYDAGDDLEVTLFDSTSSLIGGPTALSSIFGSGPLLGVGFEIPSVTSDPVGTLYMENVGATAFDLTSGAFALGTTCCFTAFESDLPSDLELAGDTDGDGICDGALAVGSCTAGPDNCVLVPNPDQGDIDVDGAGDLCDVCSNDPADTCDVMRSASASVGAAGGTLSTPDGSVSVIVPPGAVTGDTTFSITDTGKGTLFELATALGPRLALYEVNLAPEGLGFNGPITVEMRWDDEPPPGDGVIDGTTVLERSLRVTKDQNQMTKTNGEPLQRCIAEPGPLAVTGAECSQDSNTFSFEVTSFSDFALTEEPGATTPGANPIALAIALGLAATAVTRVWGKGKRKAA